jgi:hypothetical protein
MLHASFFILPLARVTSSPFACRYHAALLLLALAPPHAAPLARHRLARPPTARRTTAAWRTARKK